jgi:hypothetical protein
MNWKTRLRILLLIPFLLAGFGLFSVISILIGENNGLNSVNIIWSIIFGVIMWYAETEIIINSIESKIII